jgi:hypothetical protein
MEECHGPSFAFGATQVYLSLAGDAEFRLILFVRFVPANFDEVRCRFVALRPGVDEERDL